MAPVILVVGGAGYIGSHTLLLLRERGREVLVLDDLSEGHEIALRGAPLARGSMMDPAFLDEVFEGNEIGAVFHFAARCYVGESVADPGLYYRHNVIGTLNLLEAMVRHGCKMFVFSSSCAVYGEPDRMPMHEGMDRRPVNPYGRTKVACEWLLEDFHTAHGVRFVALRYFNAAGADPQGRLGEDHEPETHLIPLVIGAAQGRRGELTVFGKDYDTPDGTCVRDYVHVADLAEAHVLALESMEARHIATGAFNLGSETGNSVLEVIEAVERVSGAKVPYRIGARRAGDPPRLVGSSEFISRVLGWKAQLGSIQRIVETAWGWHESHPGGYADA